MRLFDLRAAAVLSLVQLACVVAAVSVATRLERRLAVTGGRRAERDTLRPVRTARDKVVELDGLTASEAERRLELAERERAA